MQMISSLTVTRTTLILAIFNIFMFAASAIEVELPIVPQIKQSRYEVYTTWRSSRNINLIDILRPLPIN